ncbi:C69 family dipeptidase [Weissella minor]|uniref:Dipeptidase n=1 Tax=Weissella minor TaxID=1620 RepID=A0A0R2JHL4_9LACO|nr:C69 family dipeptidase [Weissella minor]KRN76799.1 U34 family dipeptidase D [Weissella minor]
MLKQAQYQASRKSCTTVLVGKAVTADGSTMIARNEDGGETPLPQRFVWIEANQPNTYQSELTDFAMTLPEKSFSYTSTPDAITGSGIWAAGGINSQNVAMTASETITTNERVLAFDPLNDAGIGEADFTTLVLPYIDSARAGVERLGALLEAYGTYESNGIAFADREEIWYLETIGGHSWVAVKIPDNAAVLASNRFNIDVVNLNGPDVLYADAVKSFIEQQSQTDVIDYEHINLRHYFGSYLDKDKVYNNPRVWLGHKLMGLDVSNVDPTEQDLPFLVYPDQKLNVHDVESILSAYYADTDFDVYHNETETGTPVYRPIGMNRNEESHILQLRADVPDSVAGIHWLGFGPNVFNAFVPYFANVNDTPAVIRDTPGQADVQYTYWLMRNIAMIADADFDFYQPMVQAFQERMQHAGDLFLAENQLAISVAELTTQNQQMADKYLQAANALLNELLNKGTGRMHLRFPMAD